MGAGAEEQIQTRWYDRFDMCLDGVKKGIES